MFATYLRRELGNRSRQTVVVALGMALAIGLVIIVSGVSAGVRDAQAGVLESVYGVGTDVTITRAAEPGSGGGPSFGFESDAGSVDEEAGTRTLSQSRLSARIGTATFDDADLGTVRATDGVAAATATLSLSNTSFEGELPDFGQIRFAPGQGAAPPDSGGADGEGGSAFDIDSFTVEGVDPAAESVGPLSSVVVQEGRLFEAADAGRAVALLDAGYASSQELAVGDTIEVGGAEIEVVGIVASASAEASTSANAYLPLDTAQQLAGLEGQISTVYVQAESASGVDGLQTALEDALPEATVNTQAELASTVSGSLATAAGLLGSLGLWLSVIVLAAAFLIAILFTVSGVSRRTRELGTLKAIGWGNARIVRQVAGESLVQGLIGGAAGILVGLAGIWAVNLAAPTLTASTGGLGGFGELLTGGPGGAQAGPGGTGAALAERGEALGATGTAEIVLNAPVTAGVILLAVGLAVLGGLLAGAVGGWRAARLRPAEALRSLA